jgi:hypothetical protein
MIVGLKHGEDLTPQCSGGQVVICLCAGTANHEVKRVRM